MAHSWRLDHDKITDVFQDYPWFSASLMPQIFIFENIVSIIPLPWKTAGYTNLVILHG